MADAHKNFAYSTVATAPSPASSGTSLVVASGDGSLFPAVPFNATIWPTSAQPTSTTAEIVRVTAISTDTLTITRAQESTSARTVVVGDQIAATITAQTMTDIENFQMDGVSLSGDVAINSGAANALTDITGLSFSVSSGQTYYFSAVIFYTVGATTTGSRWTINGPSMTRLSYWSQYTLTASTWTTNLLLTAIQNPAASNATSVVAGSVASIEGTFTPSANGTIQIQGAREVTTDTVTAKAGSTLRWLRLV